LTTISSNDSLLTPREASIKAAEDVFRSQQRRLRIRRWLLPAAGILTLIFVWAALVYLFKVPPFVAPSPQLVAVTLVNKSIS
jgi:NitT/TauT family transport system permease protein